jgi:shikimate dehydrogenase
MDRYLVLGNPVEHSLSPHIHTVFAQLTNQDVTYDKQLVALDGFRQFVDGFFAAGGRGLNITVPFKRNAYAYVDEHMPAAAMAKAVNTISIDEGRTCGHNTDGVGLRTDLTRRLGLTLAERKILILGAGGATRGILQPLLQAGPNEIVIANRTLSKATELVREFADETRNDQSNKDEAAAMPVQSNVRMSAIALEDVSADADLILNCTSMGLSGQMVALPASVIEGAFCYDLAYGAAATFSRWAAEQGALGVSDGLGMLVEQAAESFLIWRGVRPDTTQVYAQLRRQIDLPGRST